MQIDRVAELFEPGFELMELDPMANLFATLVATAFHIGIRFISKMEIIGLENYPGSPSTLVITNHKRDLDMLVIGPTLHFGDLFPRSGKTIFCGSRDECTEFPCHVL